MRVSLLAPLTDGGAGVQRHAAVLDAVGGCLFVPDHLAGGAFFPGARWADAWMTIAATAGRYERLVLGTLVSSLVLRSPAALVLCAATAEYAAPGRIRLGVGLGAARDARRAGIVWPRLAQRRADYVRRIAAVRHELVQRSLPTPLIVASNDTVTMGAVVASGDAWVTTGGFGLAGQDKVRAVRRLRDDLRRSRGRSVAARLVLVDPHEHNPFSGRSAFEELLGQWEAEQMTEVVVFPLECYSGSHLDLEDCLEHFAPGGPTGTACASTS